MKKIVILPVHGMGNTEMNYAEELRANLSKKLGPALWQRVVFHPIFFQDLIQNHQYRVWNDMDSSANGIEWKRLRQFMLFSFSDAATLEHQSGSPTIRPIDKPHPKFTWDNYYDPDDALGWPLKPLSTEYAERFRKDIRMNSGGFFTSWTPFSHTSYWKDKDFLTPVAAVIKSHMR